MAALKVVKWKPYAYEFAGKAAVIKKAPASVYAFTDKGEFVELYKNYTPGGVVGMTSGKSVEMSDGLSYWLVTLKTQFKTYVYGYVTMQDFYFNNSSAADEVKAKSEAQILFDKLIAGDKLLLIQIYKYNAYIEAAEKKLINVAAIKAKVKTINDALIARQQAIANNPAVQITKKIAGTGIGIIPLIWAAIVGAGIVIVGLTMYYFLKPEYNTSQLHSKYLADNEADLKKLLGPEKYAEVQKNVDQEIKDAGSKAYDEGKGEGFMTLAKPLAFGLIGFFVMQKFLASQGK